MSEQDGTQSSTKKRRSRKTNNTNQQNGGKQTPAVQCPLNDDTEAWKAYWKTQGQPWRTEPEIVEERQKYLAERRCIRPDIEQGIYPFKGIRLSRADIEWLLATHENGRGPVDWSEMSHRQRNSVDLRGADLRYVNLQRLPLARIVGGLTLGEMEDASEMQCRMAAALMEGVVLRAAHLEFAFLSCVCLKGADLRWSHLERARLHSANLEQASLDGVHLDGAHLNNVILSDKKHIGPRLADIQWGMVNLTVVKWLQVKMLGDEYVARQKQGDQRVKDRNTRLEEHEKAVRANRQLAVVLQTQGLSEDASRFAYRAQHLQRKVFWYQHKFGQYLFSLFLDLLTGYGYKPLRSFIAYLVVIATFATAYFLIGLIVGPALSPLGSFVFSMTSFHGRGFFPGGIKLDDPLTVLAAIEAFVGLLIEVTFIATLTQRLFGK